MTVNNSLFSPFPLLISEQTLPGPDRNFALENYGTKSKCFDHTDKMWEEMNCEQVRQWQHWGSGCYKYHCKKGRLHIEVLNQTFTCFYPQQEIPVSLISQNWLHSGSLVCPPCEEICGAEFRKYGQKCRPGQAPPRTYVYTYDGIGALCGCYKSDCNQILLMASILVTAVYYNFVQRL